MKNLALLFIALIFGTFSSRSNSMDNNTIAMDINGYGNSFIFEENGITFSVYPDGEFDFYINNRVALNANINLGAAQITFNSGYNYDPYVQYDDYGAVIQVENVPIYYDYYGRVAQIGDINIRYNNGRVYRLGGMSIYYNPSGYYSYHTGFINVYNRYYVYRPYYNYFVRPVYGHCIVFNRPYRRYYTPIRYTYYRPYISNTRRAYVQVGQPYKYNSSDNSRRATIYRNDKRVVARDNSVRRNDIVQNSNTSNRKSQVARNNGTVQRSNANVERNSTRNASAKNVSGSTTKRQVITAPQRSANTSSRTVDRSPATSKPDNNNGRAAVTRSRSEKAVNAGPTQSSTRNNNVSSRGSVRQTVHKTTSVSSKNNNATSRASVSRSVRKAPSVSSGNNSGNHQSSTRRR